MKKLKKLGLAAIIGTALAVGSIFGNTDTKATSPSPLTSWNQITYSPEDLNNLTNITYAEAASEPEINRELVAKLITNRKENSDYPNTINDVINDYNGFTATFDGSKWWKQATGELPRNPYEEMVYQDCKSDAREILEGKIIGIPRENEIIAYHDKSIRKPNDNYWNGLEPVFDNENIIFYAPIITEEPANVKIFIETPIEKPSNEILQKTYNSNSNYLTENSSIPNNHYSSNNILGFNPYKNNFPKEKPTNSNSGLLARMRRIRKEDEDYNFAI